MNLIYRYEIDTGLEWAAVLLEDSRLSVIFRSSCDGTLQSSISLEQVNSTVLNKYGGMLSFGEQNLYDTGTANWLDLTAKAYEAGTTIPKLIKHSLQDNYSIRLLVPNKNISSLRNCDILFYMRPQAVLLSEQKAIAVSGPLESARLLKASISSFNNPQ